MSLLDDEHSPTVSGRLVGNIQCGSVNDERPGNVDGNGTLGSSFSSPVLHVYRRRWYILVVYSTLAFMQGGLLNTWTVVAKSAEFAFGWTDRDLQLMQMWIYISYLIAMLPFAWLLDKKGLRIATVLTAGLMVVGTVLRCITAVPPTVTWLAHVGHFVIGVAGPLAFTGGPTISSLWFPPEQRTTATAIATVAGFAGSAGCFIFGPLMVQAPDEIPDFPFPPSEINVTTSKILIIRQELLLCRYIECGICVVLLILCVAYFPSRPPSCPSISSALGKLEFSEGVRQLFSKTSGDFWLICMSYCISVSIYGVWSGLFGVILKDSLSEGDIGWLGFAAVSAGTLAAVLFGRLTDLFVGHMKVFLLVLNVCCILSTYWFILVALGYIPYSKAELFVAGILQGLTNNGAIPLFYEMAMESTYPVAEVCTSMVMTIIYNTLPLIFLLIMFFSSEGSGHWMSWCMFGAVIISFPMLLGFKEQYRRLLVDQGRSQAPSSLQNSLEIPAPRNSDSSSDDISPLIT